MRISPMGGRRPKRAELDDFAGHGVDPILGPDPRLLIVGVNPGLWTAAVNAPFAHPGNRFWPSLYQSGLTPWRVDAAAGLAPADEQMMHQRGIALTNLSGRATVRADELTAPELRAGREKITEIAEQLAPQVVAVLGITAYRTAFEDKHAQMGRQGTDLAGAELWALPQPSGINAHATMPVLVDWWQQVGRAAGLLDQTHS